MKHVVILLLVFALLPGLALGETLYYFNDDEAIAADISAEKVETDSRMAALNAVLKDDHAAALLTQQELIESLQGYSEGDVKTDIQLVRALGQSALYVVCSEETAGEMKTLSDLAAYLQENEYALQIMRCFTASNADYASMMLMDAMALDSEMFVDDQEKWDSIGDGPFILVAEEENAIELNEKGYVVLGALTQERTAAFPDLPCAQECGLPVVRGTYYGLFAKAGADASAFADAALSEETLAAHHLMAPDQDISLEEDITHYVDYMTGEGLFFY